MAHQSLRRSFFDQQQYQQLKQLWLIIEWAPESRSDEDVYGLISSDELSVKLQLNELHTGKKIEVFNGEFMKYGSIVIVSSDKRFLEMEIKHLKEVTGEIDLSKEVPAKENLTDSDAEDFQGSDTDWNPNTSDCGSEDGIIDLEPRQNTSLKRKRGENLTKLKSHKKVASKILTRANSSYQMNGSQLQAHNDETSPELNNVATLSKSYELTNSSNSVDNFDKLINDSKQRLITGFKNIASTEVLSRIQAPPMTFDQQTQTNTTSIDEKTLNILLENQKLLRTEMMNLYTTLDDLKNQMHKMQRTIKVVKTVNNKCNDVLKTQSNAENISSVITNNPYEFTIIEEVNTSNNVSNGNTVVLRDSNSLCNDSLNGTYSKPCYSYETSTPMPVNKYGLNKSNMCVPKENIDGLVKRDEMVPIGRGKTEIPHHIFSQIKWNSYSNATRKLLMAVFPRRTLATHSLTGKPSPAFNSRPPKLQLDARKISDIIITVTQMCNVPENLVRTVITTKCSDENKMYKLRQKKLKNKNSRECDTNQENKLPDDPKEKSVNQTKCISIKQDFVV